MSDSNVLPVVEDDLGVNAWLVDEMREQWREDPDSVDANWQALFADNGDCISRRIQSLQLRNSRWRIPMVM